MKRIRQSGKFHRENVPEGIGKAKNPGGRALRAGPRNEEARSCTRSRARKSQSYHAVVKAQFAKGPGPCREGQTSYLGCRISLVSGLACENPSYGGFLDPQI
jgi:hypothetical protein